ncbi:CATION/H + ANTIPORTER [Salix purpurea]|uniref:CATION/H + ANTIPORTER n=1 Tax=Salix purpurea TaxID=77065 RepID=A0A9Q0VAE1_SALPP|nr:CATION/H + ANTIPORTER [Salix purpurea]
MILSVVVLTGVISPLVKALYDPSRRFLAYRRRTICHHRSNEELRILACVLSQDNARTIINLLDVSNHTNDKPIVMLLCTAVKAFRLTKPCTTMHLNKSVLDNAPCSVGVLVDRGNLRKFLAEPLSCRIAVLFFGGADDREALAYAVRMSGNPHVSVKVFTFHDDINFGGCRNCWWYSKEQEARL